MTTNINRKMFLAAFKMVKYTNWKLVMLVPINDIYLSTLSLKKYLIVLVAIIGAIAYALACCSSFSITRRIERLIKTMKKIQEGNFNIKVAIDSRDEIGELEKNFNFMLDEISKLISEIYRVGQEAKNSELKALQAQINPHFLYNTLDLINWKAEKYKAEDIKSLIYSLAKFYKLSLSKGKDVVSIENEINMVQTYVQIQNERFKGKIQLLVNVDKDILGYSILKLILQPLVENSILHGILEKESKTGIIEISGKKEGDIIRLTVKDDGIGITDNMADYIINHDAQKGEGGYGVKNVNDRIKISYGKQYGLFYKNGSEKGASVDIVIPAIRYQD